MPEASEPKTAGQIAAAELADPAIRREYEWTALAQRGRHAGHRLPDRRGLSQTAPARMLGMHQPFKSSAAHAIFRNLVQQ
jgi:hypothetical protein